MKRLRKYKTQVFQRLREHQSEPTPEFFIETMASLESLLRIHRLVTERKSQRLRQMVRAAKLAPSKREFLRLEPFFNRLVRNMESIDVDPIRLLQRLRRKAERALARARKKKSRRLAPLRKILRDMTGLLSVSGWNRSKKGRAAWVQTAGALDRRMDLLDAGLLKTSDRTACLKQVERLLGRDYEGLKL